MRTAPEAASPGLTPGPTPPGSVAFGKGLNPLSLGRNSLTGGSKYKAGARYWVLLPVTAVTQSQNITKSSPLPGK